MPVSAPAIQRNSLDRCACSIVGWTREVKSRFSRSVTRGGREREHGEEELRPERLAGRRTREPRQDRRDRVDDGHGALVKLPPPQPRAISAGAGHRQ